MEVWVTRRWLATRFSSQSAFCIARDANSKAIIVLKWVEMVSFVFWMWRHNVPPISARKPVGIGPSSGETMQRAFHNEVYSVWWLCEETWRSFALRKATPFSSVLQRLKFSVEYDVSYQRGYSDCDRGKQLQSRLTHASFPRAWWKLQRQLRLYNRQ